MNNAPCYGCADRSLMCHAHCVAYREWREAEAERRKKTKTNRQTDADAIGFLSTRKQRNHDMTHERAVERFRRGIK